MTTKMNSTTMELRELNNHAPTAIQMNGAPANLPNNHQMNNGTNSNNNYNNLNDATQQMLAAAAVAAAASNNQHGNNPHSIAQQPPMRPIGRFKNHQNGQQATNINGSQQQQQQTAKISTKQHRELPVDVPDSFVGMAKQSPRYPPPKIQRQISPPISINNNQFTSTFNNQPNQIGATAGSSTVAPKQFNQHHQQQQQLTHSNQTNNKNRISNKVTINGAATSKSNLNSLNNNHQQPTVPPIAQSAATSIMTHNSSLRSSIKLKQLEKSRNQHGNAYPASNLQPSINQGFELNEDDDGQPSISLDNNTTHVNHHNHINDYKQQHLQDQQITHVNQQQQQAPTANQDMNDLCSLYSRLQNNLNEDFADVAVDVNLPKLLSIYNTIIKTHDKNLRIPSLSSQFHVAQGTQEPVVYKLSDLLFSVQKILRNDVISDDVLELSTILRKHEMDGVCLAFDRIAQSFEFAKLSPPPSPRLESTRLDHNGFQETSTNMNTNQYHINSTLSTMPVSQMHNHQYHDNYNATDSGYYLSEYTNFSADNVHMDIENNLYPNGMHPMTEIDLNEDGCTKTVHIDKGSNQPIGVCIKNEGNRVIVNRIICGGVAHDSGVLNEGDEIIDVNGIPMQGKNINDVVPIIESLNGTLSFTIITSKTSRQPRTGLRERVFVRAFFDFDGETESFNPCKELGLSFKKGEILSIIDQNDEIWWQATREHDSASLAGLIPSLKFLNQKENHLSSHDTKPNYFSMKHEKKNFWTKLINCPKSNSMPRSRRKDQLLNMPFGPDQIPYYEEVYTYYPDKYHHRPIILVGPKMIGQREIVAKLLQDCSHRFASAVSHTSRPRQPHERCGVDFHFVTRAQFELDMKMGKFIECGQYLNQYYGTSLEAMREVVRSKKICVHLVNTPSIFNFRHGRAGAELKPYFVFVKPDDHPDKLRNIVASCSQPKSDIEENIRAIMAEVQLIETYYRPYFDYVLTVTNIDCAYQELKDQIEKVGREPNWIPAFWKNPASN